MLNLDVPKVVLITRENFIKFLRVIKQNEKEVAINDDEESSNSLTEIAIQKSVQNSSFDIETDKLIQHTDFLSDEYSNSDEEINERNFDKALTLLHEAKSKLTDRYQFKINMKFKAVKKVKKNKRFNKNNSFESSDTDLDEYESISSNAAKELQASEFGEEIEYKHANMNQSPDVANMFSIPSDLTEDSLSSIDKILEMLAVLSIIEPSTSLSNINEQNQSDKLIFQIKNLHYQCKSRFNKSSDNSSNKINESTLTLKNSQQANNSIDKHIKVSDDDEIMFDAFSSLNNDNLADIIHQ
ncbi:14231_t:CDS:10, partial [Dentiscutata heterogama]